MKTLVWMIVVFGFLSVATADEKKEKTKEAAGCKCVVNRLDKAWGIEFKSIEIKEVSRMSTAEIRVTLGFTKDVSNAREVESAFIGGVRGVVKGGRYINFYIFDKDDVSIRRCPISGIEGEITGMEGDAFRVVLKISTDELKKLKKLEARSFDPPKKKK